MKRAQYTLERHEHGWLLASPDGHGIPATALSECEALFPRGAVLATGITHHLRVSGRPDVVFCVCSRSEMKQWSAQILAELASLTPEEAWWRGLDVGTSSAAIFSVFCTPQFRQAAAEFSNGSVPRDADDFGRCKRLIDRFPEWRQRLAEVGLAYPATKWAKIVERWDEIASAEPSAQGQILAEIS